MNSKTRAKSTLSIIVSVAIAGAPTTTMALEVKDIPNSRLINNSRVTDMANILSPATETSINHQLSGLEAKNGTEMAVVIVPSTAPAATPKEFAIALFNYWGIGKKGQDNGILLLISQGERRVEVEIGYGVEDILPDAKVGNIISQEMKPKFKKGNFDEGTLAGTEALVQVLESGVVDTSSSSSAKQLSASAAYSWLSGLILGLGAVVVLVVVYRRSRQAPEDSEILLNVLGDRLPEQECSVRPTLCPSCNQAMDKIGSITLRSYLSQQQQVAEKLGSVDFQGWHCPSCHPELTSLEDVYLRTYPSYSSRFKVCPICQEWTVTHTSKITKAATQYQQGKQLRLDTCQCCDYRQETAETIDRLPFLPEPPPSRNNWSSSDSGSYSGSSDWGSSSSSDYSSGSSDWGGGSSGGGGAGDSW